jgi:hypothetical protein
MKLSCTKRIRSDHGIIFEAMTMIYQFLKAWGGVGAMSELARYSQCYTLVPTTVNQYQARHSRCLYSASPNACDENRLRLAPHVGPSHAPPEKILSRKIYKYWGFAANRTRDHLHAQRQYKSPKEVSYL